MPAVNMARHNGPPGAAQARAPVDRFFTDIMVMDDDLAVRNNRLALLAQLHGLMNQVADISRLAS